MDSSSEGGSAMAGLDEDGEATARVDRTHTALHDVAELKLGTQPVEGGLDAICESVSSRASSNVPSSPNWKKTSMAELDSSELDATPERRSAASSPSVPASLRHSRRRPRLSARWAWARAA